MSIWDKKIQKKAKIEEPQAKLEKELSDEIKALKQKDKEFQATNDMETYIVICFSTKEDKKTFLQNLQYKDTNQTYIDGYELASRLEIEPKTPKFKLRKPLSKL